MSGAVRIRPFRDGAQRGRVAGYLHVYSELVEGLRDLFPAAADGTRPVKVFAQYLGDDRRGGRERFARVHEDVLYEQRLR